MGRQQQYNRWRAIATEIQSALSFCEDEGFKPRFVKLENVHTQKSDILDISNATYSVKKMSSQKRLLQKSVLFLKDKYCVLNQAYHELSVVSNFPVRNK